MKTQTRITNTNDMINKLRADGHKVFVSHKRPIKGSKIDIFFSRQDMIVAGLNLNEDWDIRGGKTTVHIYDSEHTLLGYGESVCSRHDVFNKNRGLTIALGRALSNARL
jgi:hypothetical protein